MLASVIKLTLAYKLVLRFILKHQDLGGNRTHNLNSHLWCDCMVYHALTYHMPLGARWWEVRYLYTSILGANVVSISRLDLLLKTPTVKPMISVHVQIHCIS